MKIFFKQLFCNHNWKLDHIDRKVVYLFGWNPIFHYECTKCKKRKYRHE